MIPTLQFQAQNIVEIMAIAQKNGSVSVIVAVKSKRVSAEKRI